MHENEQGVTAEKVAVTIGTGMGGTCCGFEYAILIKAYNTGDLIIIRGAERLQDGQSVVVKNNNHANLFLIHLTIKQIQRLPNSGRALVMNLTASALKNPTAVIVAILLVALFGVISVFQLPIQLTPDISKPEIIISTGWRSAAPEEIEAEIIERQEDVLKGLQGLESLISSSNQGKGDDYSALS